MLYSPIIIISVFNNYILVSSPPASDSAMQSIIEDDVPGAVFPYALFVVDADDGDVGDSITYTLSGSSVSALSHTNCPFALSEYSTLPLTCSTTTTTSTSYI